MSKIFNGVQKLFSTTAGGIQEIPAKKCDTLYFSTLLVFTQNKNKASNSIQFEIPRYHIHHVRNCLFFFFLAFIASLIKPHTQSPSMDCALVCISLHFLVHPSASPRGRRGRPLTLKSDERERAGPNLCGDAELDAELDANWRVSATGR